MACSEIRAHWDRVAKMRCLISGAPDVTLHHCKGGSMIDTFGDAARPGVARKVSDWLVIPIAARFHVGEMGIDTGMGAFRSTREWEEALGTQVEHLTSVSRFVGYNVFERAGLVFPIEGIR